MHKKSYLCFQIILLIQNKYTLNACPIAATVLSIVNTGQITLIKILSLRSVQLCVINEQGVLLIHSQIECV